MITIETNRQAGECDYRCKSTDTKPTQNVGENSLCFEVDTGDWYYFDGATWAKVGG